MKFFFFGLFILPMFVFAQQVKVSLSNEFKVDDGDFLSKSGDFFYKMETSANMQFGFTFKLSKTVNSIVLYKYDNAMNEIKKNALENGEKKFGPFAPKMFNFDNTLLLFYYKYFEGDTVKLFVSQIDPGTLATLNTKEVFSFSQKNFGFIKAFQASAFDNQLFLCSSPDKSRMLVAHSNAIQISSCIIDKNLNITEQTSSQCPDVKNFLAQNAFVDNNGNKYISYQFGSGSDTRNGTFIQNVAGKETFKIFNTGQDGFNADVLKFKNSKDGAGVYVYGAYSGDRDYEEQGVLFSKIDATNLTINAARLFAYTEDIKKRMYDFDFGDKRKGEYYVRTCDLVLTELDNGTLVVIGFPTLEIVTTKDITYAGPILATLISNGKSNSVIIPRKQGLSGVSTCIFNSFKNSVVCVYTDNEKNIAQDINGDKIKDGDPFFPQDLVLVSATINSDGSVVNRQKIADRAGDKNCFILSQTIQLPHNSFLIPIGRDKATMTKIYTQLAQFATLEIQ